MNGVKFKVWFILEEICFSQIFCNLLMFCQYHKIVICEIENANIRHNSSFEIKV